jgi:hypothetical protein
MVTTSGAAGPTNSGPSKFITKPVDFDLLKEHFAPAVRIGELTERGESAARRLTSALDEYVQKPRANVRFTAGRKIRWLSLL